jgi:hypothetical protein
MELDIDRIVIAPLERDFLIVTGELEAALGLVDEVEERGPDQIVELATEEVRGAHIGGHDAMRRALDDKGRVRAAFEEEPEHCTRDRVCHERLIDRPCQPSSSPTPGKYPIANLAGSNEPGSARALLSTGTCPSISNPSTR